MENIEVFECNAEAIICGDAYDVRVVSGPNVDGLCTVDIPFDGGFVERLSVIKGNIFPLDESAVSLLMKASYN